MEGQTSIRLVLNNAISENIVWECNHYTGRGVRKLHESGTAPAEDMEAPVSKRPGSIEAHCQASLKTAKDPNGGPHPAYPSGKSWNETSGKTGSEKKFYHNVSSGADFEAQPYCVAEYVGPTPEVTHGHDAHAVECVTPASSVAYTAPVTTRHRQVPLIQRVQKMEEVPQVQSTDKEIDIPVINERQMSMMDQVQKKVEVPRVQFIDRVVDDSAVMRRKVASNMVLGDEKRGKSKRSPDVSAKKLMLESLLSYRFRGCRGIKSCTSWSRTNDYVKLRLRHCVQLYAQQHHA